MFSPDRYTAALRFAARRHLTQKVPDSELPYVVHVTSVAADVIRRKVRDLGNATRQTTSGITWRCEYVKKQS